MTTRERAYAKLEELKELVLSDSAVGEAHNRLLRQVVQAYTAVLVDAINPYYREELPYILAALKITTSEVEKSAGKEAAEIADAVVEMLPVVTVVLPQNSPLEDAARAAAEADL